MAGPAIAELEPGDKPPAASSEQHPPPAPGSASSSGDRQPRRERSGAEKRKRAKAKAGAGSASSRPAAGAVLNRELRELEDALNAILVTPAVPMHMAGDHWPAEHLEQRAGPLAHQVVELARRNPAFRAQLQRALSTSENAQLAFAAAAYLVPVLIYFGLIPVPDPVRVQLQVPDRHLAQQEAAMAAAGGEPLRSPNGTPPPRADFTETPPAGTAGTPPAAAPGAPAVG